jgi:hypothetical protein
VKVKNRIRLKPQTSLKLGKLRDTNRSSINHGLMNKFRTTWRRKKRKTKLNYNVYRTQAK